ncbi:MAG TPA: bifunctional oligoribonuclease/PAP phosphatase NrnA [Gemmatimonadaceae bacterium]|nr:bifunctional oligoribonuclease/PAP phosphatase NrnA [Gemmatimonadaceae bacterium]
MTDLLTVPAHRQTQASALWKALDGARTVALSTHVGADGDGCGAEAALARVLMQKGIDAYVVNPTPWPALFSFLLGDDVRDRTSEGAAAITAADCVIVVDISDLKRLGVLADSVRKHRARALTIDHHPPGDEPLGEIMLSDTSACAAGELIYDFAVSVGATITPDIATALYAAILTDTGSFRYANTTPRTHVVAGELLRLGVDPEEMYRRIYASFGVGRVQLLAESLATLGLDREHGLAWIDVAAGALERYGVTSDDLDGVSEYPRSIAGTRVAMVFRDLGHGKIKVSFRSVGDTDVNVLARQFGGGGHPRASGALIPGKLEDVRAAVLAAARENV